ncbi:hypothetical protein SLEP1_g319 [Rubroshorea leprosula]|uniref:Cyclopropane-fatty-acyl-phospholipid synthase n=1 Tax=Rubroshorea leprosula TaxID=152421 RepID=A0AAV5HJH0_9ROSI|nr:hypothetical protein SLEP1_g319 [Rubroshorea leprosula]
MVSKHMAPSLMETGARLYVIKFLRDYISTGCVILLEEGGTIFTFEGNNTKCSLRTVMKVHNPQFYWKVMTQEELGLADAFISGDFSLANDDEGLLNLFMILIANRDLNSSNSKLSKKRGWWRPLFFTAGITSAKYFFKHVLRQNTLTQARRNISRHYDLSNELFALFLDETMTYSCAVFKKENEELKVAQQRKISLLIEKARIKNKHEILEIGCGWGGLAIEQGYVEIHALGFDEKFVRTWEYYFDYCAAGFKSLTLGNYQVVFSRPGNVATLQNPY